ncbi:MAG TPA: gephyrin-like molybdotransferase Glp [bacterium]|nr:gephyrin-like molybdotransferase Glp [bacterium]
MPEFLTPVTPAEAHARFARVYTPRPRGTERVSLRDAHRRVLARDIVATEDLPEFDKATVDGYAVRAADTADASERRPASLTIAGEVQMGSAPSFAVGAGEAARMPTGGMVPRGADAIIMLEQVEAHGGTAIQAKRRVAPGENVLRRAEDVKRGEAVLRRGARLRPQDVGLLAGIGVVDVEVYLRPRVAVLATGDEIIPPDRRPGPGEVRDINTYTLSARVEQEGGTAEVYGIIPDDREVLLQTLRSARAATDLVLVSGGSSVGAKDAVAWAINTMGAPGVVVHGVRIKPGKPTILGLVDGTPVIGLPGHTVSGLVIFDVFVRDLLRGLAGRTAPREFGRIVRARLGRRVPPAGGREDHVRVSLEERDGGVWAVPQLGKSGVITTMTRADGVVVVPLGQDGLEEGAEVDVELFEP